MKIRGISGDQSLNIILKFLLIYKLPIPHSCLQCPNLSWKSSVNLLLGKFYSSPNVITTKPSKVLGSFTYFLLKRIRYVCFSEGGSETVRDYLFKCRHRNLNTGWWVQKVSPLPRPLFLSPTIVDNFFVFGFGFLFLCMCV